MSPNESTNIQSIKELEWLAHFYLMHGRADLAEKIRKDVELLRYRLHEHENGMPSKSFNNIKPDSADLTGPS